MEIEIPRRGETQRALPDLRSRTSHYLSFPPYFVTVSRFHMMGTWSHCTGAICARWTRSQRTAFAGYIDLHQNGWSEQKFYFNLRDTNGAGWTAGQVT